MSTLDKLGIKTGVVPPGGWRYVQPTKNGPVNIPLKGGLKSVRQLLSQVRAFRITNHIDTDYIEEDLADWLKLNIPESNRFPNQPVEPRTRKLTPLISSMRDKLVSVSRKRPRLLLPRDASERAEVCAKCPQNVRWLTACEPCNDEVVRMGQNVRQKAVTEFDDELKACRLHRVLLMTAVFLDTDLPERHNDAPSQCWMPPKQPDA